MTAPTVYPRSTEHEWLALRAKYITSTEVAGLFNLPDAYATYYQLWHRKQGNMIVEFDPSERMLWGSRLQQGIAVGVASDHGWSVREMSEFMALEEERLGASFDWRVHANPGIDSPDDAILEIKNVDALVFRDEWLKEGEEVEAPVQIEVQVQAQLAVSGLSRAYIAALVGGNRLVLIERKRDEEMIRLIRDKVAGFWRSIDADEEPSPILSLDASAVAALYRFAAPGKVMDARGNEAIHSLVEQYVEAAQAEKEAKERKEQMKARLLMLIGDAEKVVLDGTFATSISAGIVGPAHVEYDREGYRSFRVNRRPRGKR